MNYGTGKPKIKLMNADGTQNDELSLDYAEVIEPEFKPDAQTYTTQNDRKTRHTKGWWVELTVFWPKLSDVQFAKLVRFLKYQDEFDGVAGDTKFLRFIPRDDVPTEFYDGWITTPIGVLNKWYFISHSAKIAFEGRKLLGRKDFLQLPVTNLALSWPGTVDVNQSKTFTVTASRLDGLAIDLPMRYFWKVTGKTDIDHQNVNALTDQSTYTFTSGTSWTFEITVTPVNAPPYTQSFTVPIGA